MTAKKLEDLDNDQQFNAFALTRCRDHKEVSDDRMLSHFGVSILIESVSKNSNDRRADLVQKSTGIKRNSALKMGLPESISLVQTALSEKDTSAKEIFDESGGGISTVEIVQFFPPDKVFDLWFHSGFITSGQDDDKAFMADIYDFINQRDMFGPMTALTLVQEIGMKYFISDECPIEKRLKLLETVLQYGEPMLSKSRDGASSANAAKAKPFTAANLLATITPTDLVGFVPLTHLSKPIYTLATTKGWIKQALPPEALDSVVPPALPAQVTPANEADGEAKSAERTEEERLADEVDALEESDDAPVVMVDGDGDDDAKTVVAPKSAFEVPRPPQLRGRDDKKKARA